MQKYFLHVNNKQQGPFSLEELKQKNISKDAPVWFEGQPDWKPAGEITELKALFTAVPPPFSKKEESSQNKGSINPAPNPLKKPKSIEWHITRAGIVLLVLLVVFITLKALDHHPPGSGSSTTADPQTYQQKVMTVEEIERADPAKFLEAGGRYNENFWGDAMKVHGTITNKATVANYKDAVVEITFYSNTDTELDRKRYVIYKYLPAHSTVESD